ncbi:MAG: hypothetical protein KME16_14995 [Scytolyngbya sp. HA4215-MV1]|jgi:hypothetical protein|nr:hypothetical protein [Scytolyngbya sp. HA4215-MV1]
MSHAHFQGQNQPSTHLATRIQTRPWSDYLSEQVGTEDVKAATADFSHVDLFSHAPVRGAIQTKLNTCKSPSPEEPKKHQTANNVISRLDSVTPSVQMDSDSIEHPYEPDPNMFLRPMRENFFVPGDVKVSGGKKYVIYDDEVRQGGTVSWVARNPGNIRSGEAYGAYPGKKYHTQKVGDFAIFPDEMTGFMAIIKVLQGYGHITVAQAMGKYAPKGDGNNDPIKYAQAVAKRMGVRVDTFVDTMADEQLSVFAEAIKTVEGWKPGNVYARDDQKLPKEIRDYL